MLRRLAAWKLFRMAIWCLAGTGHLLGHNVPLGIFAESLAEDLDTIPDGETVLPIIPERREPKLRVIHGGGRG